MHITIDIFKELTEYLNIILIPQTDDLFSLCNSCKQLSIIPYRKVIGSTWEIGVLEMHIMVELMFTVTIAMPDMHVAA